MKGSTRLGKKTPSTSQFPSCLEQDAAAGVLFLTKSAALARAREGVLIKTAATWWDKLTSGGQAGATAGSPHIGWQAARNGLLGAGVGGIGGALSSLFAEDPEQRQPLSRALRGAIIGGSMGTLPSAYEAVKQYMSPSTGERKQQAAEQATENTIAAGAGESPKDLGGKPQAAAPAAADSNSPTQSKMHVPVLGDIPQDTGTQANVNPLAKRTVGALAAGGNLDPRFASALFNSKEVNPAVTAAGGLGGAVLGNRLMWRGQVPGLWDKHLADVATGAVSANTPLGSIARGMQNKAPGFSRFKVKQPGLGRGAARALLQRQGGIGSRIARTLAGILGGAAGAYGTANAKDLIHSYKSNGLNAMDPRADISSGPLFPSLLAPKRSPQAASGPPAF